MIWFETAGRRLTEAQLRDLVLKGRTRTARWTVDGKTVAARLMLDAAGPGGARLEPTADRHAGSPPGRRPSKW